MRHEEYERLQDRLTALQSKKERQPSSGSSWRDGWKDAILAVKSMVHSEFKADPVRHGHWVSWGKYDATYECSVCHEPFEMFDGDTPTSNGFKYCPNCGTKMDEKMDEVIHATD